MEHLTKRPGLGWGWPSFLMDIARCCFTRNGQTGQQNSKLLQQFVVCLVLICNLCVIGCSNKTNSYKIERFNWKGTTFEMQLKCAQLQMVTSPSKGELKKGEFRPFGRRLGG